MNFAMFYKFNFYDTPQVYILKYIDISFNLDYLKIRVIKNHLFTSKLSIRTTVTHVMEYFAPITRLAKLDVVEQATNLSLRK